MTLADAFTADAHVLLLHRSQDLRLRGLRSWVRQGLADHDQVICPRAVEDGDDERVLDALGGDEPSGRAELVAAVGDRRLRLLPAADYYPSGAPRRLVTQAFSEGFHGVMLVGDAASALSVVGRAGYLAFERELERLCDEGNVSALCTYDEDSVDRQLAVENLGVHSGGVQEEMLTVATFQGGVRLDGQVDQSNADVLEAMLLSAVHRLDDRSALRVVLSELTFCAVAGARALLLGTESLRARGGVLELADPTETVRRTLEVLHVLGFPGVTLVGSGAG